MEKITQNDKIEIFIHGRDFPKLESGQIIMYKTISDNWEESERTELSSEKNPNFQKSWIMDFIFGEQQYLKFELVEIVSKSKNKFISIGEIETTVSELIGSKNQTKALTIFNNGKKKGKIILRCDKYSKSTEFVKFQMKINKVKDLRKYKFWVKSSPFIRIYKY